MPAIMMPVWPVARNVALRPRARSSRSSASAVYFLPTAQSVPTVSRRRPARFAPVATRMSLGGTRMSTKSSAEFVGKRAASPGAALNLGCMPLTMS